MNATSVPTALAEQDASFLFDGVYRPRGSLTLADKASYGLRERGERFRSCLAQSQVDPLISVGRHIKPASNNRVWLPGHVYATIKSKGRIRQTERASRILPFCSENSTRLKHKAEAATQVTATRNQRMSVFMKSVRFDLIVRGPRVIAGCIVPRFGVSS